MFHQDIELIGKSHKNIDIYLKPILAKQPDLSVHKNTFVVQIQNEVVSRGDTPLNHLIDVSAKLVSNSLKGDAVDIKDIVIEKEGKDIILHYAVYDMCNIDDGSYISLHIEAHDGEFNGFVSMIVVNLEAFSIKCIDKDSETFIPREQHAACETWDKKVWVFGGKRTIGKKEQSLNDLMVYDADKNTWKSVKPSYGQKPSARSGHTMM